MKQKLPVNYEHFQCTHKTPSYSLIAIDLCLDTFINSKPEREAWHFSIKKKRPLFHTLNKHYTLLYRLDTKK